MGSSINRKQNFFFFILFQILVLLLSSEFTVGLKKLQPKKAGSSSFKIAIFADLHFGEDGWTKWGPRQDVKSQKAMSSLLDHENPGLFLTFIFLGVQKFESLLKIQRNLEFFLVCLIMWVYLEFGLDESFTKFWELCDIYVGYFFGCQICSKF